jgi:peroxiredoxin-like protein
MSEHRIDLVWSRGEREFTYETFDRSHSVRFFGGQELRTSSAPDFFGDGNQANPEELLVAALSSCHMLTFLAIATKRGLRVDSYRDAAVGVLEKNAEGRFAVTRVTLRPVVEFGGDKRPSAEELAALHHRAHQNCMIANSVRSEVTISS